MQAEESRAEYVPGSHGAQVRLLVDASTALAVPAGQVRHEESVDWLKNVLNVPNGQAWHDELPPWFA